MPARNDTIYATPLPPSQVAANNAQLQGIYSTFRDAIMAGRYARGSARRTHKQARADIRRALQQNLTDVEASNIERGTLGSSTDYQERVEQRAAAERALADALAQKAGTVEQSLLQDQLANRAMNQGLLGLGLGNAAAQADEAVADFSAGTGGGGGGGGTGGGGEQKLPPEVVDLDKMVKKLLNRLADAPAAIDAISGQQRGAIVSRLRRVWERRNQVRRDLGLRPLPRQQLRKAITEAMSGQAQPGTGQQA